MSRSRSNPIKPQPDRLQRRFLFQHRNVGMAHQDRVEKRRARPRKADKEDRRGPAARNRWRVPALAPVRSGPLELVANHLAVLRGAARADRSDRACGLVHRAQRPRTLRHSGPGAFKHLAGKMPAQFGLDFVRNVGERRQSFGIFLGAASAHGSNEVPAIIVIDICRFGLRNERGEVFGRMVLKVRARPRKAARSMARATGRDDIFSDFS